MPKTPGSTGKGLGNEIHLPTPEITSCYVSSSPNLRRNAHSRCKDTGHNLLHISDGENIDGKGGGRGAGELPTAKAAGEIPATSTHRGSPQGNATPQVHGEPREVGELSAVLLKEGNVFW
uniref:Uncharacterized protein n=1 Tax=Terrapene triunguis TaxID=2587831 RepID=A0A674JSX7_9SAUR